MVIAAVLSEVVLFAVAETITVEFFPPEAGVTVNQL